MLDDYNNKFSVFAFALESVMDDDSHYPYIIFPYGFSEKLFDDITMKSILEFCRMKEGDLPCLQNSLSRPLKPMEPQKKTVPTTHDIMVKESFFRSSIGHVFLIWLVVAFFLGALPGYSMEGIELSVILTLMWIPVLLIMIHQFSGWKRMDIPKTIPYSKDEIDAMQREEDSRYEKAVSHYPFLLNEYEEDLKQYNDNTEERERIIRSNLPFYLRWYIKNLFPQSQTFSVVDESAKMGRSENILFRGLMDCIPDSVHIDTCISGYYPDLMVSTSNNVYFDIEIDEPYDMETKKEIHYVGGEDESRNERITKKGWGVIRFSEKQIMTNLSSCIKIIELIKSIVENGDYKAIAELPSVRKSIIEKRWSKEEARLMALNNYRKSY